MGYQQRILRGVIWPPPLNFNNFWQILSESMHACVNLCTALPSWACKLCRCPWTWVQQGWMIFMLHCCHSWNSQSFFNKRPHLLPTGLRALREPGQSPVVFIASTQHNVCYKVWPPQMQKINTTRWNFHTFHIHLFGPQAFIEPLLCAEYAVSTMKTNVKSPQSCPGLASRPILCE